MNTPTEYETTAATAAAAATKTLLDHYRLGEPLTSGRVGWLTGAQQDKLRQLWALLLAEMATAEPLPVLHPLAQPAPTDSTQATDLTSLSFEPLVPLSSDSGSKKPTPWWLSAWASKPAPTPPSEKEDHPLRTQT
ncbi:hypothetical protein LPJ53_004700, partial [Coemansia erecta]